VPDPIFADERLARIYDAFDGPRDDLAAYVDICEQLGARAVADVGCGTGSLAVLLAARGVGVTGVDPAMASLEVARSKPMSDAVTWIHGDVRDLAPGSADLVVMTGNVAQVFLTDEDWRAMLFGARRALKRRGHLVFESRRPEDRAWERWALEREPTVRDVPGLGLVEQRRELTAVDPPRVSFRFTYRFADGTVVASDSTLRFRSRSEIEDSLAAAGFETLDVRDAPDRPGCEHVFVAARMT